MVTPQPPLMDFVLILHLAAGAVTLLILLVETLPHQQIRLTKGRKGGGWRGPAAGMH